MVAGAEPGVLALGDIGRHWHMLEDCRMHAEVAEAPEAVARTGLAKASSQNSPTMSDRTAAMAVACQLLRLRLRLQG